MKRLAMILVSMVFLFTFGACGAANNGGMYTSEEDSAVSYTKITAEEAKELMDTETDYIILDVRTEEEYNESHIPGALLLPNETIGTDEISELPDKDQLILIYCRSGNRSAQAAEKLVDLEYTNVYDFGGIIDWPYETE